MAHCYCLENNESFSMVAGECGPITFHMVDKESKTPFNISGYSAEFTAVDCINRNVVQISKKPDEVTVIDDLIIVRLGANDTNKLLPGKYLYQLEIWHNDVENPSKIDAGPEVVSEGSIFIRRNYKGVNTV